MRKSDNRYQEKKFIEKVVKIRRVTKVVKGGRRFGFSTFAVVGDGEGSVGCGLGKALPVVGDGEGSVGCEALEISESAKKAVAIATKDMKSYSYFKTTIPHEVVGYFCSAKFLKPAAPGSGIIANGSSRMS